MRIIDIGRDFSIYPAGRYADDGDYSGEVFRRNILIPALVSNEKVEIILDNTRGYDSSFLEEAFGGLFREMDIDYATVARKLILSTDDKFLRDEILSYMVDASKRSK